MTSFEQIIALGLRIGVLLSITLIIIGLALLYASGQASGSGQSLTTTYGVNLKDIFHGAALLDGMSFILLGIVVLIATPVVRVLLSVFHFAAEKDWLYVVITLIVLIDLLIAILVMPHLVT